VRIAKKLVVRKNRAKTGVRNFDDIADSVPAKMQTSRRSI
jgi:hypothetical protein